MKYIIDLNALANKNKLEIQNYLKNSFSFDDDYGCNLDAFIDYLSCIDKCIIELFNVNNIKDDYILEVYDCINISARENSDITLIIK